jgi:hypothetical protein
MLVRVCCWPELWSLAQCPTRRRPTLEQYTRAIRAASTVHSVSGRATQRCLGSARLQPPNGCCACSCAHGNGRAHRPSFASTACTITMTRGWSCVRTPPAHRQARAPPTPAPQRQRARLCPRRSCQTIAPAVCAARVRRTAMRALHFCSTVPPSGSSTLRIVGTCTPSWACAPAPHLATLASLDGSDLLRQRNWMKEAATSATWAVGARCCSQRPRRHRHRCRCCHTAHHDSGTQVAVTLATSAARERPVA